MDFISKLVLTIIILTVMGVGAWQFWGQSVQPMQPPQGEPVGTVRVTVYALELSGSHIFDGAWLSAIDVPSGKIVQEQVADGDGRAVFELIPGTYRFQPSPGKETRLANFYRVKVWQDQTVTLRLTEIGPSGFGAPVQGCQDKQVALLTALENANYCEKDSDCTIFEDKALGCAHGIYTKYDTSILRSRITEYVAACPIIVHGCPAPGRYTCQIGKCKRTQGT